MQLGSIDGGLRVLGLVYVRWHLSSGRLIWAERLQPAVPGVLKKVEAYHTMRALTRQLVAGLPAVLVVCVAVLGTHRLVNGQSGPLEAVAVGAWAPKVPAVDPEKLNGVTLIFARESCGECAASSPELRSLVAAAHSRGRQVRLVDSDGREAALRFGGELGLSNDEVISLVGATAPVPGVPFVIDVSSGGKIVGSWNARQIKQGSTNTPIVK
jgi:hypothetical protein